MERFCNNLKRVTRFNEWKEAIPEAYFPKLDSLVASRAWPARVENQMLSDLRREQDQITQDLDDLRRWRDRIFEAIHSGSAQDVKELLKKFDNCIYCWAILGEWAGDPSDGVRRN